MLSKKLAVVLCLAFLVGFVPTSAQDTPFFEPIDCTTIGRFPATFDCGYLHVAADRSQADGQTLRLMVAIYHPTTADPKPDPIVYLSGGPGGGSVAGAIGQITTFTNLGGRDVIFYDQRGTGFSEPVMTCPEIDDAFYPAMEQRLTPQESSELALRLNQQCHDRLIAEGIDLTLFNSAASAADVNDLRVAMGFDQVNLYGISYGTRLALTIMRDYPDGIRSVILDSVYPPNVDGTIDSLILPAAIFEQVFDACAADVDCNHNYPDLHTVFYEVVDQLNANPMTIKSNQHTLVVDGYAFISALYRALYNGTLLPEVPHLIYQLHDGNIAGLSRLTPVITPLTGSSLGMSYSVQCREEIPFSDESTLLAQSVKMPPLMLDLAQMNYDGTLALCDLWGAGTPNPLENQAVVSDIPTILFSGEFDPITPHRYAQLAASTLSNSYEYLIPNTGHGVLGGSIGFCAVLMSRDFLDDPYTAPELKCPADMPLKFR